MQLQSLTLAALSLPVLALAQPMAVGGCPAPPRSSTSTPSSTSTSAPAGPTAFTAISARSASPIHLEPIQARGQAFYIGGDPATYCPQPQVANCPPGTATVFAVGSGTASLDVEVPGGQQIFVGPNGALGFTAPHSASIPAGSLVQGFTFTPGSSFGYFSFTPGGLIACPNVNGTAPYQVFANIPGIKNSGVPSGKLSDCLGFDALTEPYSGTAAAWEYT